MTETTYLLELVVTKITVALVDITLKHQHHDNFMLPPIREFAERLGTEPRRVVEGAIEVWAQLSMRHSANNPFRDFGMESKVEIDTDGSILLDYNDELADQQQLIPDLGQLAMFLIAEIWQPPSVPRLRTAYLMANTTTTMLFGAFTILPYLSKLPWEAILQHNKEHMGLKLFLQTAWKVCRPAKSQPPSVKFAASLKGAFLSKNGKRILSDNGSLQDWHPSRRVPGSLWNKFFRNSEQPMFSASGSTTFPMLHFRMPSSLVAITDSYHDYYLELKEKFDEVSAALKTPQLPQPRPG